MKKALFDRTRGTMASAAETAGQPEEFAARLKELDERWKPTRKALSSLVSYSDSLTAVAEAGKVGAIPLVGAITAEIATLLK